MELLNSIASDFPSWSGSNSPALVKTFVVDFRFHVRTRQSVLLHREHGSSLILWSSLLNDPAVIDLLCLVLRWFLARDNVENERSLQRCQSGLKSGGRGSGSTEFQFFQANFREILIFSRQFHKKWFFRQIFEKFRFFRQIFFYKCWFFQGNFRKISMFSGKFSKEFKFFRQLKKIDFPGKNCSFPATSG